MKNFNKALECEFETEQNISPYKQCQVLDSYLDTKSKNKYSKSFNGEIKINNYNLMNSTEDKLKVLIKSNREFTNNNNSARSKAEYCLQVYFKSQFRNVFEILNISLSYIDKSLKEIQLYNLIKNNGILNFLKKY